MKIRQITASERPDLSVPIQAYAFQSSPASDGLLDRLRGNQQFYEEHVTLVAEVDGVPVADASAIPMQQNIRGVVYPMAGIAGVATLPHARRHGYASALVTEILGLMRDGGHAASTLYPFRPSFYERFGFVGLPVTRTVGFPPSSVGGLLNAKLNGTVRWGPVAEQYDAYRAFIGRLLASRHGFALLPESRLAELRDTRNRWLATAWADDTVVGAVTYRVSEFGGDLIADDFLVANSLGRTLLLQFFALHADQTARVSVVVPAGDIPELWATDFSSETRATISFPRSAAPMARILALERLAGLPVGNARAAVEVIDDPFIAGHYVLDGTTGVLDVRRVTSADAAAVLTSAGLAGLIYGVLDADDVRARGFGQFTKDAAERLNTLFTRSLPYLYARF
jgi:predicted acetyltransferase